MLDQKKEDAVMILKQWKDKDGNCRCESCGKTVSQDKLYWERGLGYCASCYKEIQKYNKKKR